MIDDFFAKAHELVLAGVPFVTATVVRAEKPTSGKPGDKAIITVDGVMHGWIGGSCAQPTVIKEALKVLAADEAKLIRLSTEPEAQKPREGLVDMPMTCFSGGTLEIYLEPQAPRPRLLIVGTLPVARALAHLGSAMNYHVTLVDLDGGMVGQNAIPHVNETLTSLDNIASKITPYTYIVVASHGNYDELALEKLLAAHPGYVGLVASRKRAEGVRDYLLEQGLSETDLLPLKAPAGLDIQARRGDEIALSIMAEIVQRRRNAEEINLALFRRNSRELVGTQGNSQASEQLAVSSEQFPVSSPQSLNLSVSQSPHLSTQHSALSTISLGQISVGPVVLPVRGAAAIDPICHMEVEISTAKYTHEHNGTMYYFCCAGCQRTFAKEPEKYR